MTLVKKSIKFILLIIVVPLTYVLISLLLTVITINKKDTTALSDTFIYLGSNGVHLDIILQKKDINSLVLSGIKHTVKEEYVSFGWGDEDFYKHTNLG